MKGLPLTTCVENAVEDEDDRETNILESFGLVLCLFFFLYCTCACVCGMLCMSFETRTTGK